MFNEELKKFHEKGELERTDEGCEVETDLQWRQTGLKEFKVKKSAASCHVADIEGFIYGPFSSRFWLMRKHMNSLQSQKKKIQIPFHAWDCITLNVKGKGDVYLVIKGEQVMSKFLKYLLYLLRSVDGNKNSANKLIELDIA